VPSRSQARLPHRPQIKPALRRAWRDDATLQIGLTPETGVILAGLDAVDAQLIDHLDGTQRVADLIRWAGTRGIPAARVRELLGLLDSAGVLTGAPTDRAHLHRLGAERRQRMQPDALAWSVVYADAGDGFELLAHRTGRGVLLIGRGTLADACALAVGRTGVQLRRSATAREGREVLARDASYDTPYPLVVLVDDDTVQTAVGSALLAEGVTHLAVVAGADHVTVGPFVRPGRSACLHCLQLARTDRDPLWPAVAAQLDAPVPVERGEAALVQLAAGLTALQVACWADERRTPASVGATLTVTLPDGLTTRRSWPRHPRCGCAWLSPLDPDL
jgi:bacteriocin biosynthesis cyclodehydratase domain-containing protein